MDFWGNETRRNGLHIAVRSTRQASAELWTLCDGILMTVEHPHNALYVRAGSFTLFPRRAGQVRYSPNRFKPGARGITPMPDKKDQRHET
jgi:hypothetical protein